VIEEYDQLVTSTLDKPKKTTTSSKQPKA